MPDLWTDLKLAFTIIAFIFLVKWSTDKLEHKTLGVMLAAVIAYLTFYSHFILLVIVIIFFFGYPIFEGFYEAMSEDDED